MKGPFAVALVAAVAVAGCGTDTCSSSPATPQDTGGGALCSVAPASTVTIYVKLCSKCYDSFPSCQAEFLTDHVEVAPVVQQCQANAGCAIPGCNVEVPTAACTLALPASATASSYPLYVIGDTGSVTNTLDLGGAGTSCTL